MIVFQMQGIDELMEALKELPTISMEKGVLQRSLKKSVQPLVDEANMKIPPGMQGKIGVRISTARRRGQDYRNAFVNVLYAHPLAHLFEMGTVHRYTKRGWSRGVMRAQPYVRPAYDANAKKVVDIFSEEVFNQLDKTAARLLKKAERGTLTMRQTKYMRAR